MIQSATNNTRTHLRCITPMFQTCLAPFWSCLGRTSLGVFVLKIAFCKLRIFASFLNMPRPCLVRILITSRGHRYYCEAELKHLGGSTSPLQQKKTWQRNSTGVHEKQRSHLHNTFSILYSMYHLPHQITIPQWSLALYKLTTLKKNYCVVIKLIFMSYDKSLGLLQCNKYD